MKTRTEKKISISQLYFLPGFAQYLLQQRLEEYIEMQLRLAQEINVPLLKYFKELPKDQLMELIKKGAVDFLSKIAENQAFQFIQESSDAWTRNQMSGIQKNEVVAEDITLTSYMRKKSLLHFIPGYCQEMQQALELISEIDLFVLEAETAYTNIYINLLKEKISEDNLLIERVNHTIPGAVYVFDIENFKGVYSNNKLNQIIGYDQDELNLLAEHSIESLIHPGDKDGLKEHLEKLKSAKDGEILVFKYRVKDKNGNYRWLANHEAAFKRNEAGTVIQTIGITLDIDKEEKTSEALRANKKLHEQAEAITHIGSYTWNLDSGDLHWSEELYRIYEMDPGRVKINYETVLQHVHADDLPTATEIIQKSIAKKQPYDFYYRILTNDGKEKILHARGNIIQPDGVAKGIVIGTVQDVTEKQTLIQELRHKESVYKQAEELANMGNWNFDLHKNKLEWTDQLFRIYGLEPQSEELSMERFLSFVHPDDLEYVKGGIEEMMHKDIIDYTFRIITKQGRIKMLRSVAHVKKDEHGKPVMVIGTERDITEKQNLIDKLIQSETLYKQAQALAHLGNWSWDIQSNKVEWSDELYRIYGVDPDVPRLDYKTYIGFIHPEDKEKVARQVEQSIQTGESYDLFHKIVRKNGQVRIVHATGEVVKNKEGKVYMLIGTAQDVTERQTLIDKLQESEKLSKQAQSLARLGNWSMNLKTGHFEWSDEMYHIYEVDKNTSIDLTQWLQYVAPEEKEAVMEYYQSCLRERRSYDRVHTIILHNGKAKIIHRKGEFLADGNGEITRMIGTTQDVTEEYRVQQELKENQTFIRKITDATPSIIASYNVNTGVYVFISEGLEKLLGYDRKEVDERGIEFFISIVHPDDLAGMAEKNSKAMEEANANPDKNDMVMEFTYRMRHRDGSYRWFHTYGTIFDRNSSGKVEHVLNISLDVTDQVEATTKIKEQEHFIQQIADASPTILYLYDVNTQRIEYINREIFFVLGYLPEEIIEAGEQVTEKLYHPEDYHLLPGRKQSGKTFQQVDSMIQYECRMKNKDGDWRWLLVREIVFKSDEKGNIVQILGAALDINRRKEMERTILQNTLLLEQSNASLEEFAYVASHDLKEPLRKISTFGDRLVATQANNLLPEGKIYLQKIVDASQRMQTMINDLLSISMITGNTSFERFSLQEILDETIQTLEYKIEQQNARIVADPLPEANIIPSQFRQLFQNLLSNSLKFVRPDVQPVITIKYSLVNAFDVVHYQLSQASHYHKLELSDNGIGFENEFAGKIFAIFQRLHGRSEYEGSGIGLAIVKKIVEHHGGIIYASGVPDSGARFTIILPA